MNNSNEYLYLNLCNKVLLNGEYRDDRTGTGIITSFGENITLDLNNGFPLLTTKKMFWKGIVHELLWMISGNNDITYLQLNNVNIWDHWVYSDNTIGYSYGKQWRYWKGVDEHGNVFYVDQLKNLIDNIKTDKLSRRLIIVNWNPGDINQTILPPCHGNHIQFDINNNNELSMSVVQRSADLFLGLPFNISFYSLFLIMISQVCDLKPNKIYYYINNAHIYSNHIDMVKIQLERKPFDPPIVSLNTNIKDIFSFKFDDIKLDDYKSHGKISAPVAI